MSNVEKGNSFSFVQRRRVLLTVLACTALGYSVFALTVRALPLSNVVALVVAVSSPYVLLVALTGLALAVLVRRVLLSIGAVVVVVATLAVQVCWYHLGRPADVGQHMDVRVLSSNLHDGQADASAFVRLAEGSADVVAVSELTAEEVDLFLQAGIGGAFPYSVLSPAPGARGIGMWSRFPLVALPPMGYRITIAAARVRVPGVQLDPVIASVHVISPFAWGFNTFEDWRTGIAATKSCMDAFANAAGPGAVIIVGDYNATPDMRQFRDLLSGGYRDAVEQTAAGFAPTFPSLAWFPQLITIDHLLTRQAAAMSIRTVEVRGSDHRSLLATVGVPVNPAAP